MERHIQCVVIPNFHSYKQAVNYLKEHNFKYDNFQQSAQYMYFRQCNQNPILYKYHQQLDSKGISYIVGVAK